MIQEVTFKHKTWPIAGHLHVPEAFDERQAYAAIVCVHPGSSVKEQTAGLYAAKLAQAGFIALAFDASFQGESGGEPRHLEDPNTRVEDIRCAVDYLTTLAFVDRNRIGILGICAGGTYAANAALTERRFKAVGVVVPGNFARVYHEQGNAIEILEAVSQQRTAEANGADALITPWIPNRPEEARQAGATEMDLLQAVDYYRTPRGQHPNSDNKLLYTGISLAVVFDAFHLADQLLTQPLHIVVGDKVGGFGSYRDGFELYNKAASTSKKIHVVAGAGHYDLYDDSKATGEALEQLIPFFRNNLG